MHQEGAPEVGPRLSLNLYGVKKISANAIKMPRSVPSQICMGGGVLGLCMGNANKIGVECTKPNLYGGEKCMGFTIK